MKKYLVMGGLVQSKSDGDFHYVNAQKLCRLYNVNPEECILIDGENRQNEFFVKQHSDLIRLSPRYSGDYSL